MMRKFMIAAALAASALTVAAPAAAQWNAPQGNAYGYNNYSQVRRLDARIDALQRQIRNLDSRDILSEREASRLRNQARQLEQRLHYASRNGLNSREIYNVERGIQNLEVRIQREARDGNRWRNNGDRWGQNDGYYRDGRWIDRDRDGRDDRTERSQFANHQGDNDGQGEDDD
jgi:predicted RNase H-like nuclease (RuvC/YqgF family)